MKKKDLIEDQLLRSDKFGITVRVVDIDAFDDDIPVKVEYIDGNMDVKTNQGETLDMDRFTYEKTQWLHAEPHTSVSDYLTLTDLEPVESAKPANHLRVYDVKIGDILVHPESGMRLRVKEIDNNRGALLPVRLSVVSIAKNGKTYHAGDRACWTLDEETDIYWFYGSRKDAEEDGFDADNLLITLEDLVLETPKTITKGESTEDDGFYEVPSKPTKGAIGKITDSCKFPSIEMLRKISEENDFEKLLERAYVIMVAQASDGERRASLPEEFKRCIPHFVREGYEVTEHGRLIEVRW